MSESILSKVTVMIPPPRPDQDLDAEIEEMTNRVEKSGLRVTVGEILEEYYSWESDPDPVARRRKRRAILIFSKSELRRLIALEISTLLSSCGCLGKDKDQ